ncbi:hypothetical protein ACBP93_00525 [Paenalcaligenes hominis]|uniref:hypothetical protein n=1 Tax=Paenalcaligenes hominis TaxID=643674 RepID=UPI0035260070
MATLNANLQDTRWSDSIERSIMDQTLSNGEAVSLKDVVTTIGGTIKKVAKAFGKKMIALSEAVYEARMEDARIHSRLFY